MNIPEEWKEEGIKKGASYLLLCSDDFSYEAYPVYAFSDEEMERTKKRINSENMNSVRTVLKLKKEVKPKIIPKNKMKKKKERTYKISLEFTQDEINKMRMVLRAYRDGSVRPLELKILNAILDAEQE